ncbi:MAG: hypothetical protein ABL888_22770 [Pirellulaceae bacterium]
MHNAIYLAKGKGAKGAAKNAAPTKASIKRSAKKKYVVYQAMDPKTKKIYTGITSGTGKIDDIVKKRFRNHHTGLKHKDVIKTFEVDSHAASRGLEHLGWAQQKFNNNAFPQNNPIRQGNKNAKSYFDAAIPFLDDFFK